MPKLELLKTRQLKQPPIIFASLSFRAPAKSRSYFVEYLNIETEH